MQMTFHDVLRRKPVLLLDGAMGTELQRNGVDTGLPLWSANALLHAPHMVRNIHFWYLHAGADILTTNTFRTNIRTLERAGMAGRHEELNLRAVEYCFEARDRYRSSRPVFVAGGLAPVEDSYSPGLVPSDDELRDEHGSQAQLLTSAGVDLLLAETMTAVREAVAAAEACRATGLPFLVSMVCGSDCRLLSGESLDEAVRALQPLEPDALLLNCVSIRHMHACWGMLRDATTLPTGCYANVGTPSPGEHDELTRDGDLQEFVEETLRIASDGAKIVGGCCGTTPEHIRGMAERLCPESLETDPRPDRRSRQNQQRENA